MRRFLAATTAVLALTGCALIPASPSPASTRGSGTAGNPVTAATPTPTPVPTLAVGDCTATLPEGTTTAANLTAVPCSSAHAWEVFAVIPLTPTSPPPEQELLAAAKDACLPAFREYVGVAPAFSRYDAIFLTPDLAGWDDPAARTITCLAGREDGGLLGSAAGDSTLFPEPGECTGPQDVGLLEVEVLPCSSPHHWEVYAQRKLSEAPTDAALATLVKEVCEAKFAAFVGRSPAKSAYEYAYFAPTADTWDGIRDRRLVCSAGSPKGGITGSLKGIKR
jgi:hypothetical protein